MLEPKPEPDLAALSPEETLDKLPDYHFPPYITHAHIFNAPQEWRLPKRYLKQYALEYVIDGEGLFIVEDRVISTAKGDLILYRPYQLHSIERVAGKRYVAITVVFHFAGQPFPFENLFRDENYLGNYQNHPAERCLSELVAKYKQPGIHNHMLCQGLLLQILSETAKVDKGHTPVTQGQKNLAKLVLIKNHIRNNLQHNIQPKELEEQFGITWNYIISQFNKTFGVTPVQYLIWERIAKAKELALETNLTVSEIAERVGYHDVHSFGKMFKKKSGVSLSEYCASLYDLDNQTKMQSVMYRKYWQNV